MPHLYPLSNDEFMKLHREAWQNGWTYGPGFDELYDDYLINWVYFVDYLDLLINACVDNRPRQYERSSSDVVKLCFDDGQVRHIQVPDHYRKFFNKESIQVKPLNILIGEAPPFWAGNSKQEDRSYFYNVKQTRGSTWLNAPYKYFHYLKYPSTTRDTEIVFNESKKSLKFPKGFNLDKSSRLDFLAKEGVILLDIFPFPIRQATKIRETVTADFSVHLKEYFCEFYNKVKGYIICKTNPKVQFKYALVTPIFMGLQILYGSKSKSVFEKIVYGDKPLQIRDFSSPTIANFTIQTYQGQSFHTANSFRNFFVKIAFDDWLEKKLEDFTFTETCNNSETPLLMDGSGNVNFSKFFNSALTNLTDKIGEDEDEEDNE